MTQPFIDASHRSVARRHRPKLRRPPCQATGGVL